MHVGTRAGHHEPAGFQRDHAGYGIQRANEGGRHQEAGVSTRRDGHPRSCWNRELLDVFLNIAYNLFKATSHRITSPKL